MNGPTCQEYIQNMKDAIVSCPPTNWARYPDDPVGCWKYIARGIGHGLGDYPREQWKKEISSLYSTIVVKVTFGTRLGVPVNAKQFFGWIYEAIDEVVASKVMPPSPGTDDSCSSRPETIPLGIPLGNAAQT